MNKEFVDYTQALALKELGFDEPCFFAFDNCSTPMRCSDLRTNEQKFNGVNYNSSTYTSQPTFSQAFRWFREKHQIEAIVSCVYSKTLDISYEERRYHCYIVRDGITTKGIKFKTYEEAEQACLDKLIEIVKKNAHI